jgi:hypothetical protein
MCLLPLRSVLFMAPSARLRAWLVARVRAVGCNRDDSRELLFDWRINVHRGAFFNFWGSYCCGFGVQITVGLIGYTSICYFGHIYPERVRAIRVASFSFFEIIGGAFEKTSGSEILWKYMAPFPFHKLCTTAIYSFEDVRHPLPSLARWS